MSDTKLRELERRWKETGAVEDGAAYLLERVRVGDLTRERLELAAYCGHEGARRAIGPPSSAATIESFVHGLRRFGHEPMLVAAVVAARCAQPAWNRVSQNDSDRAVFADLLRLLERTLGVPDEVERLATDADFHATIGWHTSSIALLRASEFATTRHWRCLVEAIRRASHAAEGDVFDVVKRSVEHWALTGELRWW